MANEKKRLKDIRVDKIAFVDKPAVGASEFVISKRLEEQPLSDFERLDKMLSDEDAWDLEWALECLGRICSSLQCLKRAKDNLPPEVVAALDQVKGIILDDGEPVEKAATADTVEKNNSPEESSGTDVAPFDVSGIEKRLDDLAELFKQNVEALAKPAEDPVEKREPETQPSVLEEAGQLLAKRLNAQKLDMDAHVQKSVLDLAAQFSTAVERLETIETRLNKAAGKD